MRLYEELLVDPVVESAKSFLPGPSHVRQEVLKAQEGPPISHRSAQFEELFAELQNGLKPIWGTSRPIYVAASSATAMMEAAIRCAPEGKILVLDNGAFGKRFAEIAAACGRDFHTIVAPWGETVPMEQLEKELKNHRYSAVSAVHVETSTGACLNSIKDFTDLCHKYGSLAILDSVSGIGACAVDMDSNDLDVVISASQKALALPAGLAFVAVSERFLKAVPSEGRRGVYMDFMRYEAAVRKNQTPFTPALSLIRAAVAQCGLIQREGLVSRFRRHAEMAYRMSQWLEEEDGLLGAGLSFMAKKGLRSASVSCLQFPSRFSSHFLIRGMFERGYLLASGYGDTAGHVLRIGHMGEHTVSSLNGCLAALHETILESGQNITSHHPPE